MFYNYLDSLKVLPLSCSVQLVMEHTVLYYLFRLPYSKTIGEDTDGDLYPDIPLTFRFEDSVGVVQFPLGFCPGDR